MSRLPNWTHHNGLTPSGPTGPLQAPDPVLMCVPPPVPPQRDTIQRQPAGPAVQSPGPQPDDAAESPNLQRSPHLPPANALGPNSPSAHSLCLNLRSSTPPTPLNKETSEKPFLDENHANAFWQETKFASLLGAFHGLGLLSGLEFLPLVAELISAPQNMAAGERGDYGDGVEDFFAGNPPGKEKSTSYYRGYRIASEVGSKPKRG